MNETFEMVAKTFKGLEGVLAEELRTLGAQDVTEGIRMVAFNGDKEMLYKANFCLRTALRVLKPIYKFRASNPDELYEQIKLYNWEDIMSVNKTFSIDATTFGEEFSHSRFVTYRVKDAIVDFFSERYDKRPSIRVTNPDIRLDVHIAGNEVTLSLDSSGEPLYKRGWREAQTDAPINEVLAAGIIKLSGWDGNSNFVDPMCGSGTFLVEAALIAANINPGVYRQGFAFQQWPDYDEELFDNIYNDDSGEREFKHKIYGSDINGKAIAISRANVKRAGVSKYVELELKAVEDITEAPEGGVLITNPPYGERLQVGNIDDLYSTLGTKFKQVFRGYNAWVISVDGPHFNMIGLRPSVKYDLYNGSLDCELRQYVIFEGKYNDMRERGESIKNEGFRASEDRRNLQRREFRETFDRGDRPRFERRDDRPRRDDRGDRPRFERRDDRPRRDDRGDRPRFEHRDDRPRFERRDDRGDRRPFRPFNREPQLGADKEVSIVHGRRKSWMRREVNENDVNFNKNNDNNND
ncbi:class I SAM-dependent RNA methyltransferase [Sodaliphilus sp.]|uniref:THUMP domain-containing class I SAM-dependent RNA methyltransferase n=1 Tax=Sodaliphilus sp. TaxID=2815818 RepID=UPI00388F5993